MHTSCHENAYEIETLISEEMNNAADIKGANNCTKKMPAHLQIRNKLK
jgi:hypothetical protein